MKKSTSLLFTLGFSLMANTYNGSRPINLEGDYYEPAPATDSELESVKSELTKQKQAIEINKQKSKKYKELSRTTEKLADATEEMIEERGESKKKVDEFNKKIDCLMKQESGNLTPDCEEYVNVKSLQDSIKTQHSSMVKSEEKLEEEEGLDRIKLNFSTLMGAGQINSRNESLETNLNFALRAEAEVTSRINVGVGFNYQDLNTMDFANSFTGVYQTSYFGNYSNFYNGGREIEYSNMALEAYTKYNIISKSNFKFYALAGLSFNRSQLSYTDNRQSQFNYMSGANNLYAQFGNEEIISSHMRLHLAGGAQFQITKRFGLGLEMAYQRGLGSNIGRDGSNLVNAPDQVRLENLSDELRDANILNLMLGVNFKM